MPRQSICGLAAAAVAMLMLGPSPAAAVTPISTCGDLTKAGETYVLTQDISHALTGSCLLVAADRITIDLAGHAIIGTHSAVPFNQGIGGFGFSGVVIKNGRILNHGGIGINLLGNPRVTIRGVTVSDSASDGIRVGPNSLIKDCIVQRNDGSGGILTGDQVQIDNCVIGSATAGASIDGNSGGGISGGNRMLVTRNTVIGNGRTVLGPASGIRLGAGSTVTHNRVIENGLDGISTGSRSLVTRNRANRNGQDGIVVGQDSVVTHNTASTNGGDGIQADCPSTILYNTVARNGGVPINTNGNGCIVVRLAP